MPILSASNLHAQRREEERKRLQREEEIKAEKDKTKKRKALSHALLPKRSEGHSGGFIGKIEHLNDLDPHKLTGAFLVWMFFKLLELAFHTKFKEQQRDFNLALNYDAQKEMDLATGKLQKDDGVRVSYQQERNRDGTYKFDANGRPVFPKIYPADPSGKINYDYEPNTDGTADRFSIRAAGFVPKEDLLDAYLALKDEVLCDLVGHHGLSLEGKLRLNMELKSVEEKHKRDFVADNMVANPAKPAPSTTPRHP